MSVDNDEVRRIAELARLRLEADEVDRLTTEMNEILEHMEALRSLRSARDADALGSDLPSTRATEAGEPDALGSGPAAFAPRWEEDFFVVPPPPGVQAEGGAG